MDDRSARILPGRAGQSARLSPVLGLPLKIIQEVVTLVVFMVFAITLLKEKLAWNYLVAFGFLGVAAFFAFAFETPGPAV